MPTKEDLFGKGLSPTEYGDRLEELKAALSKSIERHDSKVDGFLAAKDAARMGLNPGIQRGAGSGVMSAHRLEEVAQRFAQVYQGEAAKSLSQEEQTQVKQDLEALKSLQEALSKDITVASPGNLHPYDLEAPAKVLVPRFTPLRNRMTRSRGQGTAREYRRILGYTNTGMGGVPDQSPFFNSESDSGTPTFGSLTLRRGQKIAYAMDVHTAAYMEMSLSDLVTWKAQFTNLGFEDSRQLSTMALLWSHLLGEEKALLYSRGASGSGYEGAVSAPSAVTTATATTGGSVPAATYYVKVTARAGGGESVTSTEVSQVTTGSTSTLTVTVGMEPTGALGYNLYVGTATGGEKFIQSFVGNSVTLTSYTAGTVNPPSADSTSNANGYDGYLSVLTDPAQSGYVNRLNAPLWNGTTGGGDKAFQDAFASLYASVYADPEEVWLAAPQRRELTDWIKSQAGGASAYRIQIENNNFTGGATVSGLVTGIVNESSPTGRIVDLEVHPYMPSGCSFINSRVLPIPDSHIGESVEVAEVQSYMAVDWPQIQFTYDSSTYWYGTMIHYAPKWSGAVVGIQ
jgi:hypothetical protein